MSDPILYEWARQNIEKDWEQEDEKIRVFFDNLKPWLNAKLYLEEEKLKDKKLQAPRTKDTFFDELAKRGASAKDLENFRSKIEGSEEKFIGS